MSAIDEHRHEAGVTPLCEALGLPKETYYRRHRPPRPRRAGPRRRPARALSAPERGEVLELLHSERFVDRAPWQAYATLLEEGRYVCSPRTMYRILAESHELRERRNQLRQAKTTSAVAALAPCSR